jgi:hypothetical protein
MRASDSNVKVINTLTLPTMLWHRRIWWPTN